MAPLAVVQLQVMRVTGTAARASQVTGAVPTGGATRAVAAATAGIRITVYVPLTLAVAIPIARRVSTPAVTQVRQRVVFVLVAPAIVRITAAVPLRIPVIGSRREP